MGSATAWQLAKDGQKVILLEQQDSVYNAGSSLGEARIARSFGGKNDKWSYLHNRTVSEAKVLIDFLNDNDESIHSIDDIYRTSPVSYIRNNSRLDRVNEQIAEQNDSIRLATTFEEGKSIFDANLADSIFLLREYKEYSGIINPSAIIRKMHLAIKLAGSEILYNHKVRKLEKSDNHYEIEVFNSKSNKTSILRADKVIAAAGPYNGKLLEHVCPYFEELIDTKRVFVAFYRLKSEVFKNLDKATLAKLIESYPCINSTEGTRDGANFSMIESYNRAGNPLIKIGGHFQRTDIAKLDEVWKLKLSEEEIAWGHKHIMRYWNFINLNIEPDDLEYESGYSCVYSLSKNEVPYVTPASIDGEMDNSLIVLAAMSGVGAKGCLAYGELAKHHLLGISEEDKLYNITKEAMGFDRLQSDIIALSNNDSRNSN